MKEDLAQKRANKLAEKQAVEKVREIQAADAAKDAETPVKLL